MGAYNEKWNEVSYFELDLQASQVASSKKNLHNKWVYQVKQEHDDFLEI